MQRDEELKIKLNQMTPDELAYISRGFNDPKCWHCRIKSHVRLLESPFGELNRTTYGESRKAIRDTVAFCLSQFTDTDICAECHADVKHSYLELDSPTEYCYMCKKWGDHIETYHDVINQPANATV
jgi:hypothetical protein